LVTPVVLLMRRDRLPLGESNQPFLFPLLLLLLLLQSSTSADPVGIFLFPFRMLTHFRFTVENGGVATGRPNK
jgi:hypothetical protein